MGRSGGKSSKRKKSLETKIKWSSPGGSSRAAFCMLTFLFPAADGFAGGKEGRL